MIVSPESQESQVRREILNRRKALSQHDVERGSQDVAEQFLRSFGNRQTQIRELLVGMYCALPTELDLHSLEPTLRQWDWKLYFPRIVDSKNKKLEFVEVKESMRSQLSWKTGPYGIQEPRPELKSVDPEELDLVFVPGVAFGENGERIGMGGGYYDRFLLQASRALRVVLAFDFQVLPALEQKETDQPVHWIFTEKREFKTVFANEWWRARASTKNRAKEDSVKDDKEYK